MSEDYNPRTARTIWALGLLSVLLLCFAGIILMWFSWMYGAPDPAIIYKGQPVNSSQGDTAGRIPDQVFPFLDKFELVVFDADGAILMVPVIQLRKTS